MFVDDSDLVVHRIEEGHSRVPQHSLIFIYLVKSVERIFVDLVNDYVCYSLRFSVFLYGCEI